MLCRLLILALLVGSCGATSRTVLGIIVEITEGDKPRVVVRLLWDSYGRDNEGTLQIDPRKSWPGCVWRLDGEVVEADAALAPGRVLWCHFNRQSLRVVHCWNVDEEARTTWRAAGDAWYRIALPGAVAYRHERKGKMERRGETAFCFVGPVDGAAPRVLVAAPRFYSAGFVADGSGLAIEGGRLIGDLVFTAPFTPRKREETPPPLAVELTLDVPLGDGEGTYAGTCGELAVEGQAHAQGFGSATPTEGVAFCVVDNPLGTQLTFPFADGAPSVEDAFVVHGKGHVESPIDTIEGSIADGELRIQASAGERTWVLQGKIVGDTVGGGVGESGHFHGRLLPAPLVPRGRIGHTDDEIPPRKPKE